MIDYLHESLLPYIFNAVRLDTKARIVCVLRAETLSQARKLAERAMLAQLLQQTPVFQVGMSRLQSLRLLLGGTLPTAYLCPICNAQAISPALPIARLNSVYCTVKRELQGYTRSGPYKKPEIVQTGANLWQRYRHHHVDKNLDLIEVGFTPTPVYQIVGFLDEENAWRNHCVR